MAKKDLKTERIVYKPFEYPEAFDYWLKQQQAHWIHTEVPMMSDINDWKQNLTETEKNIIGSILKGFAQTETVVNDYWTGLVTKWFRKPEIIAMATTFGAMETIHAEAYSLLNEELGLDDFSEFLEDETTMAKIENLMSIRDSFDGEKDWHEIAKSLAIFSAFTEGVNLFSSFAVLLSFKMRNKLKGVGQIVEWSIRDESMHSEAGCWLFRTLIKENPEGCSKEDLICFIKHRVNTKLGDLGYDPVVNGIDPNALKRMKWFDSLSAGKQHTDFFANRVTNYSKGHLQWDESIF
jgi:ribonucleoside-diphosphate reductase beta chain